uniref:Ig domain-containing protein n=1 Tax=Brucella intermedia TaxID=94625 RepID=UPI00236037FD
MKSARSHSLMPILFLCVLNFLSLVCPAAANGYFDVAPKDTRLAEGRIGAAYNLYFRVCYGEDSAGQLDCGINPSEDGGGWSVVSGALPNGLSLSSDGVLSGTPTLSGTFVFTIIGAADPYFAAQTGLNPWMSSKEYSLVVKAAPTISITPTSLDNGKVGLA